MLDPSDRRGRMSRLIAGLPEHDQRRAAVLLETCPAIDMAMDGIRGADGMAEGALLVVESGFLLVRSLRPGARRTVVALAGAGAILLPPDSHEELQALADSSLTVVTPSAHEALLRVPGVAAVVVEGIGDQLRERQESLAQLSIIRHVERVRYKLTQLARTHGKVTGGGVRIDVPLTQRLLAEMIGSARETVSLALAELTQKGFVRREGHFYVVAVAPSNLS
ncbi:MAG: Crp/Fnr family transcriptional regulator [Actinobacteria bacterium]|nr:MAG: Crp/Fnr family transcriptional regulator [Actinomycetota bacterium]